MRGRLLIVGALVLGGTLGGVTQAPPAVGEEPGKTGVVPRVGSWKGTAKTLEGRTYVLTFRVVKRNGGYEVRDLVTKGSTSCVDDDGALAREVVDLTMSRAVVRTRGFARGRWFVDSGSKDVSGTFRPATQMTGRFGAPPPSESCNGISMVLKAKLVPRGR